MRKIGNKNNRAFTLLEIIAALAILGVALGYLLFLREENVEVSLKTHDGRMARLLARGKLEELLLLGLSKTGTSGKFEKHPGFLWQASANTITPLEGIQLEEIALIVTYGEKNDLQYILKFWRYLPQKVEKPIDNTAPGGTGTGTGTG